MKITALNLVTCGAVMLLTSCVTPSGSTPQSDTNVFPSTGGSPVNIYIGGNQTRTPSGKEYYCETDVFGKTYSAWGTTEFEAQKSLEEQCTQGQNGDAFFCKDANCRKNQ